MIKPTLSLALVLMLAYVPSLAHSQQTQQTTTLMALVESINPGTITLRGHQPLFLTNSTVILVQNGGRGRWSDLRPGAEVKVRAMGRQVERIEWYGVVRMLNKPTMVKGTLATQATARQERVEKSLFDMKQITGQTDQQNQGTSHGRTFRNSAKLHLLNVEREKSYQNYENNKATYRLDESYDQLDLWLGPGDNDRDATDFEVVVRGDDEDLYRHRFSPSDRAEHVVLDIAGRQGVTITGHSLDSDTGKAPDLIIGDPILVRGGSQRAVVTLSPTLNERVVQRTTLQWRGVDGASGYLLELQCYASSSEDAGSADRFLARLVTGDATSYVFDAPIMPKGKWRWRVSALASDGSFLGEAKEWSFFSTR